METTIHSAAFVQGSEMHVKAITAICTKKTALLDAYVDSVKRYAAALTLLRDHAKMISAEDYRVSYKRVDDLHMDARMAQEELDIHVLSHGC
jgi:hypothetical protein